MLKLYFVYLKLLKQKVKLVLSFFCFFKGLKLHIGDMDSVIEEKEWPMEEL